ncbi:hypothetical protein M513_03102 [Trichuris suis]|uniref:Uncharacterized protein n=1 Tax=Trichuris suis TaxID=68888 RepID=A0A085MFI2_9BILA|nr:hypothetical protein M513_03102 [Trichuris suis]
MNLEVQYLTDVGSSPVPYWEKNCYGSEESTLLLLLLASCLKCDLSILQVITERSLLNAPFPVSFTTGATAARLLVPSLAEAMKSKVGITSRLMLYD